MGAMTNYLEKAILDHILGGPDYTRPANIYVGLSSTAINEDGTGITEPADGYARVEVANNNTNFPDATINQEDKAETYNANKITFPEATGNWGTMTHFFLADAATGGNILLKAVLAEETTIETGQTYDFDAEDIFINLD